MKLEVIKDSVLNAVSLAERVSGKHLSLPTLSVVLIEAKKDFLITKATNLDVGVEISIPAKVERLGVLALSGAILKSFLSNVSDKNVCFEADGSNLKVWASGSKATINTVPPDDFPVIPNVSGGKTFVVDAQSFISGIKSVLWAASTSTIKPELGSVYIREEADDLVFVSTDSFRLAEKRVKVKKVRGFDPILIPAKNALEITKIFEASVGDLAIAISKNQLSINTDGTHLTSRIVDGNFPDYKQIIPKEFSSTATILKQDLISAIRLSSFFSDNFNQIVITLNPKNKSVEISTKNSQVGESGQVIKGSVDGEALSMPFNYRYIADCIQSIDGESVVFKFAGVGKPLLISGASNASFHYLVMSMNR